MPVEFGDSLFPESSADNKSDRLSLSDLEARMSSAARNA